MPTCLHDGYALIMGEKGAVMGEKGAVKKEKGSDTEQKAPFLVRGTSSWAGRAPYLVPRAPSQAEREFFCGKRTP